MWKRFYEAVAIRIYSTVASTSTGESRWHVPLAHAQERQSVSGNKDKQYSLPPGLNMKKVRVSI